MPPYRPKAIQRLARVPLMREIVYRSHDYWIRQRVSKHWGRQDSRARLLMESHPPTLAPEQARVIERLERDGICHVPVEVLFPESDIPGDIRRVASDWLASEQIHVERAKHAQAQHHDVMRKDYLTMLVGHAADHTLPFTHPLIRFGLDATILGIANTYLRQCARMFQADLWLTFKEPPGSVPRGSQRWHRDPEDLRILKVFFYLSDVDESAGPLHYVPQSRLGDRFGNLWQQKLPYGNFADSEQLEAAIPRQTWEICAHPAGTIVFADTSGLHMGGRATSAERLMGVWGYASEVSPWLPRFAVAAGTIPGSLPADTAFAIESRRS